MGKYDYSSQRRSTYVGASNRQELAEETKQKLQEEGIQIDPIVVTTEGDDITSNWWGNAWCDNLERYGDYTDRISRGKNYVRDGAVLDLKIRGGHVEALVLGNSAEPYEVTIDIDPVTDELGRTILNKCASHVESMDQLVAGTFPRALSDLFTQRDGLFPTPKQIHFDCTCPDWASTCQHVAAALYGIGVRVDGDPLLLFELRGLDPTQLPDSTLRHEVDTLLQNADKDSPRIIKDEDWHDLFSL